MPDLLGGSGEKYATFTSDDRREQPFDARVPGHGGCDDAPRERRPTVDAAVARELLEPVAIGTVAGDHDPRFRCDRCRLDQEIDALRTVETVDREDESLRRLRVEVERRRRRREHFGIET